MWTINYRGFWIHGYCDSDECRVQDADLDQRGTRKSLHAAKCFIARLTQEEVE